MATREPVSETGAPVWTPARIFLAVSAFYHLLLGIVGLGVDRSFPLGPNATEHAGSGHVFGVFETNGWHSLAGILVGVVSLYFAVRPRHAREAALAIGVSQLGTTVALALWDPSIFMFASNGADQVIHSTTAVAGIASALWTRKSHDEVSRPRPAAVSR